MKSFIALSLTITLFAFSCKPSTPSSTLQDYETADTPASGQAYHIDAPRSEVKWSGSKVNKKHHGSIPISGGTIYRDGDIITGGNIILDMTRLEVRDLEGDMKAKLEGHLKGTTPGREDDFFNVGKYPTAKYSIRSSSKLVNDPDGTHLVQGDLTIRDITKPVNIKVTVDAGSGTAMKVTSAPFTIDRTEWGVRFESKKFFDNLKDGFIADDVTLEIVVGAIQAAENM